MLADLRDHGRSVGFFTAVAATCVLGSQFLIIAGAWRIAAILWVITHRALGGPYLYGVHRAYRQAEKPTLADGINGGWLLSVVAAQSVAVLGAQLAPGFGTSRAARAAVLPGHVARRRHALHLDHLAHLLPLHVLHHGVRRISRRRTGSTWAPVAISTLAGTMLIAAAPHSPVLQQILPFVKGLTLMFWATATWWIPMLVILGVWRHVYCRFPLRYDPLYWGAVFPLGMYTVATVRLSQAIDAPFLMTIPHAFVFVAVTAWGAALVGMIGALFGRADGRRPPDRSLT